MNNQLKKYLKLYDLPEFVFCEDVSSDFYRSCKRNHFFITVCIHDHNGRFLFIRNLNKSVGWELPGGFVRSGEGIQYALTRVVLEETGLSIDESTPVAFLKNKFTCGDESIVHNGLGFIASIRGKIKEMPDEMEFMYTKEPPTSKIAYQNKKVFLEALRLFRTKSSVTPEKEIDSVNENSFSYMIHRLLIKPLGSSASKLVKAEIQNELNIPYNSVLDASCGDDDLILSIAKNNDLQLAVANDISGKQIRHLRSKDSSGDIIFTNHNVLSPPFDCSFDVVVFKNTLHHIPEELQEKLVKSLGELTQKRLLIVDVQDPQKSGYISKVWNSYYRNFLGDVGEDFLSKEDFSELLKEVFHKEDSKVKTIDTIKGRYLMGVIDFN